MDLDELYRLLRSSHVQAMGITDTLRDPLLVLSADLTVLSANPAFYQTFETSREETVGQRFTELGNGQWNIEALRQLIEDVIPKTASVFDYEVRATFPQLGLRTMLVSAQRLKHPDHGQRILLLTIVDATRRREKEDRQEILIGELDHRIKNLLSVVRALARQTRVAGRTAEEYQGDFLGRFDTLARSLEMSPDTRSAQLPELVQRVMAPYLEGKSKIVVAEEPAVSLTPQQAMSLGMILHELATNALKYGALSVPKGKVDICWALTPHEKGPPYIQLRWKESHGPETSVPAREGFGTRLIRFAAEYELGGAAELTFAPEGLVATLTFSPQ